MDRLTAAIKDGINSNYRSVREFALAVDVPYTTIKTALEKGFGGTAVEKVIKICSILNIDINDFCTDFAGTASSEKKEKAAFAMSPSEKEHIKKYRKLDTYGRDIIDSVLDLELERLEEFRKTLATKTAPVTQEPKHKRKVALFDLPVSAGRGEYLDDDITFRTLEVDDDFVPYGTSYAVTVSGDSMEPDYHDGDILFVEEAPSLNFGDLGIFILNGEGYFKEYGDGRLISHNDKYKDIVVHEFDSFYTKGKVLGKASL